MWLIIVCILISNGIRKGAGFHLRWSACCDSKLFHYFPHPIQHNCLHLNPIGKLPAIELLVRSLIKSNTLLLLVNNGIFVKNQEPLDSSTWLFCSSQPVISWKCIPHLTVILTAPWPSVSSTHRLFEIGSDCRAQACLMSLSQVLLMDVSHLDGLTSWPSIALGHSPL